MRWWASLRQAYPGRRPIVLAAMVLIFSLVVGGALIGAGAATLHFTGTEKFCSSCHTNDAAAEFKDTIHDKNRTGVRAACADCHLPKEFVPMMVRKVQAAREVWGHFAGTIDTTVALQRAVVPLKGFMLEQTRESDIATFVRISGGKGFAQKEDVPLSILVPAFVTSELKTTFQIGFLLFIPFVIIDLVVASVLMSMGMMMLSPVLISLPFKIMLFVLIDGWALVMGTLAQSFFR